MILDGLYPPAIVGAVALALVLWRRLLPQGRAIDTAIVLALFVTTGGLEAAMGRSLTYQHGPVRFWSSDIKSDQNSQQIADPYTFTHFIHGAAFYGLTSLAMPPAGVATRAIVAIAMEGAWEAYENTNTVVNRYRAATISLGYYGDSVINSMMDIVACAIGFFLSWRLPRNVTITWVVVVEIMLAFWIRDNLTLNILMLAYPINWIKAWQAGA